MNKFINFILILFSVFLLSCAEYRVDKSSEKKERKYFSSSGFALIYEEDLYKKKLINKKMKNDSLGVMHSTLKTNTPVKIVNPENSKYLITKIIKKAEYPKIFNSIISKEIAQILLLDFDNPYIELFEIKKNKTFIAKKSNTFDEEKNVADKVPVDEIKMDNISENKKTEKKLNSDKKQFILIISDFYYFVSAKNLKNHLIKETKYSNFVIRKINDKKYRLLIGPFKNFNALKSVYISLNNLGFDDLNVKKE